MVQLNWKAAIGEHEERVKKIQDLVNGFDTEIITPEIITVSLDDSEAMKKATAYLIDDPVKHPSHYTEGKYECKDYINCRGYGFELGNAVKYITRAGKKSPDKEIEDLRKAVQYLDFYKEPSEDWIGVIEYSNDKHLPGLLASALIHIDKAHTSYDANSKEAYINFAKECIEAYIRGINSNNYDKEMVGNRTE